MDIVTWWQAVKTVSKTVYMCQESFKLCCIVCVVFAGTVKFEEWTSCGPRVCAGEPACLVYCSVQQVVDSCVL